MLPLLLVAPVAVWDVTALAHGVLAALLLLAATALAAPLALLARNRVGLVCAVLSAAVLGWLAAVVVVFLLHPPD